MYQQHTLKNCPLQQQTTTGCLKYKKNKAQQMIVSFCSAEMIQLLGYDPTLKEINEIWELLFHDQTTPYTFVQTLIPVIQKKKLKLKRKTLCVCIHEQDNTIVCTDITESSRGQQQHLTTTNTVHKNKNNKHTMIITRLTQYGTIDAIFHLDDNYSNTIRMDVGQPIMKYIHTDDLQRFCAGLSQATKYYRTSSTSSTVMITFSVRLLKPLQQQQQLDEISSATFFRTELTVMTIENGKVLCFMQPLYPITSSSNSSTNSANSNSSRIDTVAERVSALTISSSKSMSSDSSHYYRYNYNDEEEESVNNEYHYYYLSHNRLLFDTISHMQCKFWYALEHGMLAVARHIANILMDILWTVIDYGYDTVLLDLPIFIRRFMTTATTTTTANTMQNTMTWKKSHPPFLPLGVETLCHGLSWLLKKSPTRTKTWVDFTLGQTAEWISAKSGFDITSYYQHISNNCNNTVYSTT
ncbi:hypothetical protein BDF20DRAFT_909076 [Mycotypha africana]|uniref:uncharacterized protein n=1 Tax=Mycotypha africana TaxID=64632 RepID=UPI002300AB78|nr:uncharacterized protein BDF20DRAFT_909076 [Mycotypha africana]KAI8991271.1 hypothetical protein BDF20DRAFT_909076 [Mycotypha africana]